MLWTVETLNGAVDAELEALPEDMQARFVYISRLIEEFGLEEGAGAACQTSHRAALGNAAKRPGRHFSGNLRHGDWTARGCGEGFHQENPDDSAQRT